MQELGLKIHCTFTADFYYCRAPTPTSGKKHQTVEFNLNINLSTSGSVDGATRLAASTCRGVAWRSGLLAQIGLVCIRLTAVIITVVTLTAL